MNILDLSHTQRIAFATAYHYRKARVISYSWVVCLIRVFDIDRVIFVVGMSDGGEVTIALVDSIIFGRNRRINISVKLFDIRHSFDYLLYFTNNYKH